MSEKKEIVMIWRWRCRAGRPRLACKADPKSKAEIAEALDTGAVCYWSRP